MSIAVLSDNDCSRHNETIQLIKIKLDLWRRTTIYLHKKSFITPFTNNNMISSGKLLMVFIKVFIFQQYTLVKTIIIFVNLRK